MLKELLLNLKSFTIKNKKWFLLTYIIVLNAIFIYQFILTLNMKKEIIYLNSEISDTQEELSDLKRDIESKLDDIESEIVFR